MAKYIDYEALMRTIDETVVFTVREGTKLPTAEMRGANKVIDRIKSAPAADVVEVVRCKDCKWYQEGNLLAPNKFCFRLEHPTEDRKIGYNYAPDDFCSYGVKRSDTE